MLNLLKTLSSNTCSITIYSKLLITKEANYSKLITLEANYTL